MIHCFQTTFRGNKLTELIKLKTLLNQVDQIRSTGSPQHQGNSGAIWPIVVNGGQIVKTNPIGMTPDAMSLRAAKTLDRVGVDRSMAMRFGLSFYAFLYGGWDVFPDVIYKLNVLVKDARVTGSLKGMVDRLFEAVIQLAPPES